MARQKATDTQTDCDQDNVSSKTKNNSPVLRKQDDRLALVNPEQHIYGKKKPKICATNSRGHATPQNRSPADIVVDATDGFVPLWGENVTLKWRFNEPSMQVFQNPELAKEYIRELLGEALIRWGDAVPVRFDETNDTWDFEFIMKGVDNCNGSGCTLARAFFPDGGRQDLALYPFLFEQSREEQIDTVIHELGHVFGLRHFFAQISESQWPSEIFGTHRPFSIMNYGEDSVLTQDDKSDLKALYSLVWSGELTDINGTPVRQVRPYHELRQFQNRDCAPASTTLASKTDSTDSAMRELLVKLLST